MGESEDEKGKTAPEQMEREGPEEEGAEPGAKKKKKNGAPRGDPPYERRR